MDYPQRSATKTPLLRLKLDGPDASGFTALAWIFFAFAVVLFVGSRLWHLTDFSLWTDEIFTVKTVRLPCCEMFGTLIRDEAQAPVFSILLRGWVAIGGESLLWLKLLPLVAAIATIIPLYLLCRELGLSARATNVTLLLTAVNGYLIHYAQEVRMYSLLVLFTVISLWLFARFVNDLTGARHHLVFVFICNLLLIYTHYFGFLVVGVECLSLLFLDRRKWWRFLLSVAVLVLCFSPWAYLVSRAAMMKQGPPNVQGWLGPPSLSSVVVYLGTLSGPLDFRRSTSLRLLLFGGPVLLWVFHSMRRTRVGGQGQSGVLWWLLLCVCVPLALVYAVSTLGPKSIWHERYLIIVAMPFMVLIGTALDRLRPEWLRTIVSLLVVGWSILGGIKSVRESDNLTRAPWQSLVNRMAAAEPSDVTGIKVYEFERNITRPIQFYLEESRDRRFQAVLVHDMTAVEGSHFWLAFREMGGVPRGLPPRDVLGAAGYRVGEGFAAGRTGWGVYLLPVWRF